MQPKCLYLVPTPRVGMPSSTLRVVSRPSPVRATLVLALLMFSTSAVAQPPTRREARLWTILVSVEGYADPIPKRPGVYQDSRLLARWMVEKARWDPGQILQLNDNGDPRPGEPGDRSPPLRPTAANFDWAMEKWLTHPGRVSKDDVVLFAFAGRAIAGPNSEALLPIDARIDAPGWSPERWVERLLRDYQCSSVLCWVDAPVFDPLRPGGKLADDGERLLNRLARWPGSSVWMATGERPATGPAFAEALRAALGETPQPLLATLSTLDRDADARGLRFRQLGGIRADLSLFRERFEPPRKRRIDLLVQSGHAARVSALAFLADGRTMLQRQRRLDHPGLGPDRAAASLAPSSPRVPQQRDRPLARDRRQTPGRRRRHG